MGGAALPAGTTTIGEDDACGRWWRAPPDAELVELTYRPVADEAVFLRVQPTE